MENYINGIDLASGPDKTVYIRKNIETGKIVVIRVVKNCKA